MKKTRMICNNFSGINRSSAIFSSSIITASDIQNVELFATGINSGIGIRTAKGNISVCNLLNSDENIINIFESIQNGKTNCFIHVENLTEGRIYQFDLELGTLSLKAGGLTKTGKSSATDVSQGWSDLWVFSNSVEVLSIQLGAENEYGELEEVRWLELKDAEGRNVKGLGMVIFAGRLWIFNGQILWYSVQENVFDFETSDAEISTSAGYIEFVKNITAIYPYLSTLAVFHRDSSCLITVDENNANFSKTFDSPGGCASYRALVFHGTELYFYDNTKKGIFCFRQVVNGDKTLGENVAVDIQEELFRIDNNLDSIRTLSVVTSDRNEVWFLLPENDENYSTILIFDYLRKSWVKRKSQKLNCFAMINSKLYSAGKKIYEEYSSSNFDGEFIEAFYRCAPLNLGVENSIKILTYPPKLSLDMYYNNSFYVEYVKNYDIKTSKTHYIKARTLRNSLYFDISHWDNSYFTIKDVNALKKLPPAYFKTLQMSFSTKNYGDDFCIKNIEFCGVKSKLI